MQTVTIVCDTQDHSDDQHHEQASLDSCTGLFLRAWHAFKKSAIHLFSCTIGVNMLDLRIRIPVNGDIHNFHMLAVPMFVEHSGWRNPNLAKCGGEAQHLEKLGIWSPPGLPNV
jgi:hypothetical protein